MVLLPPINNTTVHRHFKPLTMHRNCQCVCCINVTNRSGSPRVDGNAENQLDVINKLLINYPCPVIVTADDGRAKGFFFDAICTVARCHIMVSSDLWQNRIHKERIYKMINKIISP